MKSKTIATFSICAHDPETGEWGVAVQSKFLGVGAIVPWAKAGVGAIATQAMGNPQYGPEGLRLLEEGFSADEVIRLLTKDDPQKEDRQVGIVDHQGKGATFTGTDCYQWAGGEAGMSYAVQGNILVNEETVTDMRNAYETADGPLADRLLEAIKAAQRAGGDSRGKQSAALLVVKDKAGYGGLSDVAVDLRVDDHPEPIEELERIYHLHQLYFAASHPGQVVKLEGKVKQEVATHLLRLGYVQSEDVSDDVFYEAFTTYLHTENFENREQSHGLIDLAVLEYMKNQ